MSIHPSNPMHQIQTDTRRTDGHWTGTRLAPFVKRVIGELIAIAGTIVSTIRSGTRHFVKSQRTVQYPSRYLVQASFCHSLDRDLSPGAGLVSFLLSHVQAGYGRTSVESIKNVPPLIGTPRHPLEPVAFPTPNVLSLESIRCIANIIIILSSSGKPFVRKIKQTCPKVP
ncbi:uncharacterized protein RAG0_05062 [Rhynchosporium agropyri]|uniref:Uncharacterized protein n=1 Tax=Rhynchosporium agropyri TaxID=914238 RepID=A0A1E1KBI1_9HELO|nr:uncharacterized protein RAG0_05062 [Rhynchosporium agropyri]